MRNFNDPKYKQWRLDVFKRDGFKCKKCGSKKGINAHHIKRWAKYPSLRFDVNNGITLCRKHHRELWGKEELYEHMCFLLLNKHSVDIKYKLWKMKQDGE